MVDSYIIIRILLDYIMLVHYPFLIIHSDKETLYDSLLVLSYNHFINMLHFPLL